MAKGRPADPTRERRATGNRPLAGEVSNPLANVEPIEVTLATREPPDDLSPVGRDCWAVCIAEMAGNRHLRESDLVILRAYCEAVSTHVGASAYIHEKGLVVNTPFGPKTNPMLRIQKDAAATMRQLSEVLGLNPLARIHAGLLEVAGRSAVFDLREKLERKMRNR